MARVLSFFFSLLLFFSASVGFAQQKVTHKTFSVKPLNETKALPELSTFVQQVITACTNKDTAFLLSVVSDSVAVSHGGGSYGKTDFLEDFIKKMDGFSRLKEALVLGGTIEKEEGQEVYQFPYVQSHRFYSPQLDQFEVDPYITLIGLKPFLGVYSKPSLKAPKSAVLAYPILQIAEDGDHEDPVWAKVYTFDKKVQGFVQWRDVYAASGITVQIVKEGNAFKIVDVAPFD
ncbi:hypothetical protein TH61_00925 [Rufibacter sp. DG15C]|uniref:hypothetical protein n=1 Tax=Rufibacter sp. DG15C TaxID=1379909 RepID=UPI00078EC21E|nr:hypothetical protein [Rufibacter sp. DG15C]AMM50028.1 hypothetical protein TH61_00925 [Rufibacter sp. DG15C]